MSVIESQKRNNQEIITVLRLALKELNPSQKRWLFDKCTDQAKIAFLIAWFRNLVQQQRFTT